MDSHFNTEAFTLLGISLVVIGVRFVSRLSLLGIHSLAPDDYLMLVAGVILSCSLESKDLN